MNRSQEVGLCKYAVAFGLGCIFMQPQAVALALLLGFAISRIVNHYITKGL